MTDTIVLAARDPDRAAAPGTEAAPATAATPGAGATVPWLEGALLRYLAAGSVLDIKAPDDPDAGPVLPGATVATIDAGPAASPPEAVYDAVFSRGALAVARNPQATLAAWYRMVRADGHLVIVLPQTGTTWSEEGLMQAVEAALPAGGFRVVHLDAVPIPRATTVETRLVLRKLARKASRPAAAALPDGAVPAAEAVIPFALPRPQPLTAPGMRADGDLLIRDFAPRPASVARILVFKLDHHGDFIIGLPALRDLRQAFPEAHIRLVCGPWNVAAARASGVADDVRSFAYFPERAVDWNGVPHATDWESFAAAAAGPFDIAIDLRVDEDTRDLLARVEAGLRCGIGSQTRFPMLDIALPDAARNLAGRGQAPLAAGTPDMDGSQFLKPEAFASDMDVKTPLFHESGFAATDRWLLRSDAIFLPPGHYSAAFELSARRFLPGLHGVGVEIEAVANGEQKIASKVFGRGSIRRLDARLATVAFESTGEPSSYDFRVRISGRPLSGRLRFSGLRLRRLDANTARFRPSELHVGEKLSLLVSLVRQRTCALTAEPPALARSADRPLDIVVAPFSNSSVRDWPLGHYAALIRLLAERFACHVQVLGAPGQAAQAATLMELLQDLAHAGRVSDRVGKTQWADLPDLLRAADLVICNNSGIAHQAAALGARTLAIYSASHQPLEWGPRGPRARAIMRSVPCSPCGYERVEDCGNEHACMRLLTPQAAAAQAAHLLADTGGG